MDVLLKWLDDKATRGYGWVSLNKPYVLALGGAALAACDKYGVTVPKWVLILAAVAAVAALHQSNKQNG